MGKINDSTQKKEMGFFDHVEALRWHIMRSAIAVVALSFIAFTQKKFIFDFLLFGPTRADFPTNRLFCWLDAQATYFQGLCIKDAKFIFINTDITGQFMLHIQMSLYVGAIAAFPYIFWEVWRFVKPALHEREIRNTRGIVFITSLLFTIGCLFGYFVIAPFSLNFLIQYQATAIVQNMIDINSYIGLLITMTIPTGILFELPMLVFLLTKLGILTPDFMRNGRKAAYVAILIVVAIITPQGDVTSLLLISTPILILYELSIGISNRVYKQLVKEEEF
ncbi:MAG TPA: twin-arginine translocase subunit TatC [Chitinophagales bacterium]|jgi:sec-independent protein translocase protein TatC|nr:twin-arginine translocase subunit TatC [Chitinophagales bacterium]HPH88167.1 twin-arginine translocase subunit TatC [Chitinophagales bacterium]